MKNDQRAFVVEMIGRLAIRFIEPTAMKTQFVIANTLDEATRFETAERAMIRARQEMSPSTFNVREVSSVGGWHVVTAEGPARTGRKAEKAKMKTAQAIARAGQRKGKR